MNDPIHDSTKIPAHARVLATGKYLTLVDDQGWEYVVRPHITGIVVVVAITNDDRIILVEQYRTPIHNRVIELPAGMVGDTEALRHESLADAAGRELTEETGYEAREIVPIFEGPTSVGMSAEILSFFHARGLTQVHAGGGVESEQITVHAVPLSELRAFIARSQAAGLAVDPKIFTGLYLVGAAAR